jgi:predicted acylesterase/phospholipase RssA
MLERDFKGQEGDGQGERIANGRSSMPPTYAKNVAWPYAAELVYLAQRRAAYDLDSSSLPAPGPAGVEPRVDHGAVGLALSGGGIRSATFSLGVLQALAKLDLLRHVDYLSTVSGGGYVGACVTSLLSADPQAGVRPATATARAFPLGFSGGDRERNEVRHLRDFSNYISPHHGLFKLETWRVVSWYLAALIINLLGPLVSTAAVVMPGTALVLAAWENSYGPLPVLIWLVLLIALGFLLTSILLFAGRRKAIRDRVNALLAYAAGVVVIPAFLVFAPSGYDFLINLAIRTQVVSAAGLERGFHVYGLCTRGAADCASLTGKLSDLEHALKFGGAWLVDGETSSRLIGEGLAKAGIKPTRYDEEGEFSGSINQVIAGLRHADFNVSAGASPLGGLMNTILALMLGLLPPAALGYAKRSFRVFAVAIAGVVVALLITHGLWLLEKQFHGRPELYIGLAVLAVGLGFININRVSMLNLYRDRLADCYIIRRDGEPIVTNDDLQLKAILSSANGPYQLVNATLNLSGSKDLSLRGRMAAPFVFSKFYCGSPRLGYRASADYDGGHFELATAMAISGAAVSPQSGSSTRPGIAVLLSLLNLRLGQWVLNPQEATGWPGVWWSAYFAKELFSLADENDKYVLVSDGGHFDNTGIYPLLERRCRTIIAVDASCDERRQFDDFAALIRKARIDFGITIDLDLRPLHGDPMTHRAMRGHAAGSVLYPARGNDPGGVGQILYLKPTLDVAESETEDLREYMHVHPAFPHEPTTDQFFEEAQFESYRALGYAIAKQALST